MLAILQFEAYYHCRYLSFVTVLQAVVFHPALETIQRVGKCLYCAVQTF